MEMKILKTGYKGLTESDSGHFYCPISPYLALTLNPDAAADGPPLTWQGLLNGLQQIMQAGWHGSSSPLRAEQVNQQMQNRFPGPYTIREDYNPKTDIWSWRLRFEDKHQEIIWHLKNSS